MRKILDDMKTTIDAGTATIDENEAEIRTAAVTRRAARTTLPSAR